MGSAAIDGPLNTLLFGPIKPGEGLHIAIRIREQGKFGRGSLIRDEPDHGVGQFFAFELSAWSVLARLIVLCTGLLVRVNHMGLLVVIERGPGRGGGGGGG